ncbi:2-oxoglutarate dehydrogenase E1 component [Salsuginibacillus halophilus]|uniref:2-oxoglutarate dehydrogenase E1 component n=1 Tax=Salsuginibacillus halophilus TaxID=517424 RepID=A0A2P8HWJ1_9BACI|nr:2-oxoglutarate dehydrogenase E1 component [Salsuginibacillus halophilus]PSL50606.1 2-oxoglutarate dehydrogenase E1 component [Salsuginibacillus halophilus]
MSRNQGSQGEPWEDFHGPNLGYVLDAYEVYKQNPEEIDPEMKEWFDRYGPPKLENGGSITTSGSEAVMDASFMEKVANAVKLSENIRVYGHLFADINPLEERKEVTSFFEPAEYGLENGDLEAMPASMLCPDAPNHVHTGLDAVNHLKSMHTTSLGFEFDHVHDVEESRWLNQMVESGSIYKELSNDKRKAILEKLTHTELFEQFIHKTYVGQKRFSVEGLDAMVPMVNETVHDAVKDGTNQVFIGMAHRGRLNILANVLGKPYDLIFSEFAHSPNKELIPSEGSVGINDGWTGDVKYHLGADRSIEHDSHHATVSLANNPSHLEFVNPVVEGYTRAAQEVRDTEGFPLQDTQKALAILIHGDAAFPGQGIVAETLNLSRLKGYQTGGTVHVIANNQLGFTTESHDSRSTTYASDLAKGYEIPIVHVNADDLDACIAAMDLAYEYRRRFNKDFVIDLIGYRRFGHNEMDEPAATQPQLYDVIRNHPSARARYAEQLINEGVLSKDDAESMKQQVQERLQSAYGNVSDEKLQADVSEPPEVVEKGLTVQDTSVSYDLLKQMNDELITFPEDFNVFPKLKKILERRGKAFDDDEIDWAHAEALAFASIVSEGTPLRLTGQDSERGTFAHRHIVLHDYKDGDIYSPLHDISTADATFAVHNSPLSEASAVGFEYGYNVQSPETMVLWEAQFGDFSNSAQVLFDQFISSGRAKWGQKSGMVFLLPHGYEGQGPEHSSARLERFLQMAAENNWNVCNLSSAAQYFHILRRQAHSLENEEIRPLVLMTPKSLLRNAKVACAVKDLTDERFHPVLEEPLTGHKPDQVKRLILGSGKITVNLHEELEKKDEVPEDIHVVRLEELYPFPAEELQSIISRFSNVEEIVWVQEEPKNMGAWGYIVPSLWDLAPEGADVKYTGRRRRSSPSEGDPNVHKKDQARIIDEALTRS